MEKAMNIEEIKKIIPHRYPFLLVDKILDYEDEKWIKAVKNITFNEPFFQGHFPGKSVMPGVLLIEAMAQAGAVLLLKDRKDEGLLMFTSIEKAKFRKPAVPGDVVELNVEVLKLRKSYCKLAGKAYIDGKLATEAIFSSAMVAD